MSEVVSTQLWKITVETSYFYVAAATLGEAERVFRKIDHVATYFKDKHIDKVERLPQVYFSIL